MVVWTVIEVRARLEDRLANSDCNSLAANLAAQTEDAIVALPGHQNERGERIDRWGTPYRVSVVRSADTVEATVTSAGRDRVFGTDDDIVVKRGFGRVPEGTAPSVESQPLPTTSQEPESRGGEW